MNEFEKNVAIDGPVASGKTTIGKDLARRINYRFLDSGLLFRHFAKLCLEKKISPEELAKSEVIETVLKLIENWKENFYEREEGFIEQLEKNRESLTLPEVSRIVAKISPIPELRRVVLDFQRKLAEKKGCVIVGRDITSKVLPEAEVKIFLTANLETRVERR
jgi:cytidylate kinase